MSNVTGWLPSDPSFQHLSPRSEFVPLIREALTEGYVPPSVDYEQLELRVLAHPSMSSVKSALMSAKKHDCNCPERKLERMALEFR